ncbi:MAG TPA: DUF3108 domain-containing protein [Thermodesulfovibrionales bacterium]|nr:DUF3108 domain-containing protein [Thermodesulfovibrionales bacterium]
MKSIKNKPLPFIIALTLSLVVHLIALAGARGVTIAGLHPPDFIVVNIEKESMPRGGDKGSIRDVFQKSGQKREAKLQNGLAETGARSQRHENLESEETPEEKTDIIAAESDADTFSQDQPAQIGDGTAKEEKASASKTEETTGEETGEKTEEKIEEKTAEPTKSFREKLNYDLYWLGIYVGKAALETTVQNSSVTITSQAHSAKFLSNFYKVEDYSESRIEDGMPLSFRIRQHEGKYRSNKETRFDLKNRKVTYFDHLKDIMNEHDVTLPLLWDVVSGFFYLRIQPLEIGKKIYVHIFDSDKILSVQVDVLRKEKIDVAGRGETDTIIVKPILMSEGLFQKKGDVLIWLTDDTSRIPVRVETEVPIGKVVAQLRTIEIEK